MAADHPFVRREVSFDEGRAIEEAAGQAFKVEILDDLARKAEASGEPLPPVTFYEHGPFRDLCKGPHVASTGHIGPFKLLAVAGAYWRGDEKRPMLQRIYGTAWESDAALKDYLHRLEEAEKREHRAGVALDLYSFHDVARDPPLCIEGQRIWRTLEMAMRELQDAAATTRVHADPRPREAVAPVGPPPLYAETCSCSTPRARRFASPMNCPYPRSSTSQLRSCATAAATTVRAPHRNERSGRCRD